jgi:demethylmenaquinone methyltransferase/2-methoxy-6-polyprenyl-1,4-benzoquinol methylase
MSDPATSDPGSPVRPHPVLRPWYGDAEGHASFVRALFDSTAPDYDRANQVLSLGSGAWYRRQALRRAGLRPGMIVLDVAIGTGLLAREAARIAAPGGSVTGIDVSLGMLAEARRHGVPATLVQGRAEALPVADACVDLATMGYALRHVADLGGAFREFRRVLRPGGAVLLLEIARPDGRLAEALARLWFGHAVPWACRVAMPGRQTGALMRYYWETIEGCVPPETILGQLRQAGFAEVACTTALGLFREYRGVRAG